MSERYTYWELMERARANDAQRREDRAQRRIEIAIKAVLALMAAAIVFAFGYGIGGTP